MKLIKKTGIYVVLCVLCWACGRQTVTEGIPVVELDKAESSVELKLSDFLENIRVIPLETHPDALLPGSFYTWIGDKYIVTFGHDDIRLFTIEGKYVGKLAQQGRGPDEYLCVMGYCVDEQERYCYLAAGGEKIMVIDLDERKVVGKIPTGENIPCSLLYSAKDSTLVYTSLGMEKKDGTFYDICRIGLDGTLLYAVKKNSESEEVEDTFLSETHDTLFYKTQLCDTLFMVADTIRSPYCRFVIERPYSINTGKGKAVRMSFGNEERFILAAVEKSVRKEDDAIYTRMEFLGYYTFEKRDFVVKKVSGFYVDILDYTETEYFPLLIAGKKAYWNMNVLRFKELLKNKLDSPLIPEYVKELYHKLDEEDNPVVLVGDTKA